LDEAHERRRSAYGCVQGPNSSIPVDGADGNGAEIIFSVIAILEPCGAYTLPQCSSQSSNE